MTCISLAFWWWLVTLGPSPQMLARFETAEACWRAQATLKASYSLTGRTTIYAEWGAP